jgi:hypothetical protein
MYNSSGLFTLSNSILLTVNSSSNNNIYNVQLNSPQLAYEENTKKYYKKVIKENNKISNAPFEPYTPEYFETSYDKIHKPDISDDPY